MDSREQRGLIIAALCKLNRTEKGWIVPSQSGSERIYTVDLEAKTCTCPDHVDGGFTCKHWYAVKFTVQRECHADGTVIETKQITITERKTYKQNWPAYNEAQTTEKKRFQRLLFDLCAALPKPERNPKGGQPRVPLADSLFAAMFKIYSTVSSRRFACDLADAHEKGYTSRPLHYNKISQFLESKEVTPILCQMISRSAMPLRIVDVDFAVDSSGFSSSKFVRWYDEKYGVTRQKHSWVKVHLVTGVKTNIVTAVRILDKDSADSPQFAPLMKATAENFKINDVSADKGYLSNANMELVESLGGVAFIHFKENSTPGAPGSLWEKLFGYYQFGREDFLKHYHKRSNVESTFSMIKAKFGDHIRSRTETAMVNETLGKILCHNICCVIMSQCELAPEQA